MKEEVFHYGENNRGLGLITLPDNIDDAPVIITLNAGLIHREGPYRLNVLICRALAQLGHIAIRMNLSGKGDTPSREGLTNRESVALDWQFIKQAVLDRFGPRNFVLVGLCSGADNTIKIAATDSDVRGLVLLDPESPKDHGFARRQLIAKISNYHKWLNLPNNLLKRIRIGLGIQEDIFKVLSSLRDTPTPDEMQSAFRHIVHCQGKVLAIFTSHTLDHYNKQGQFVRALNIAGFDQCCEEVFWPLMDHVFSVQTHRDQLVKKINDWASANLSSFKRNQG